MRIEEVMTVGVRTVRPTMPAPEAWELMRSHRIHHLVVTEGARVVGLFSDRDAGSRVGASLRRGRLVEDLMTRHVATIELTETVRKAANLMRGRSIGCLPVTRGGRLVGIVTTSDLLELLGRGVDRPPHQERRTMNHKVPHRGRRSGTAGVW